MKKMNSSIKTNVSETKTIVIGLINCLLLFANYRVTNDLFMFAFLGIGFCLILLSDIDSAILYLLIFSPFQGIIRFSFSGIYFDFIFSIAFIINCYIIKRKRISRKLSMIYLLFICYILLTYDYTNPKTYVSSGIVIISYFLLVPLTQHYKKEKFNMYVLAFASSFLLSSVLGFLRPLMPKLDGVLRAADLWIGLESFNRFSGISWDTNIFGLFCSLSCVLILCTSLKLKYKSMALAFVFLGLLSYSKMFVLALLLICFLYVVFELRLNIFKVALFMFFLTGFLYIINILSNGQISEIMLARFSVNDISSLTTNRSDLQLMYLQEVMSNTKTFMIGASFGNENLNNRAAHNTFIQIFYTLGIIGTFIFSSYIFMINKEVSKKFNKFRLGFNVAPLIVCGFTLMSLSMFTNSSNYIVFFLCLISFNNTKEGASYVRKN